MKRTISVLVTALFMVSMLGACAPAATPQPAAPTTAPQPTTAPAPAATAAPAQPAFAGKTLYIQGSAITFPGQEDAWNQVNAAFTQEYGAKVVTHFSGQWSDIPQQLETSRLANETVDITTCGANQINSTLVRSGVIMDMTDLIKPIQDRWVDGMFNAYTIDGHIWALPWDSASTSVVFYNATMFKELGINPPTSYADLQAAAKVITAKKPGVLPWIHEGKLPFMWPMWFMETFAQTSGDKSVQDTIDFLSGNRKFTSPEEAAAFAALVQYYKDGILTQASMATDGTAMDAAFAQQKAAMMYDGTWELPALRTAIGNSFELGAVEFPMMVNDPSTVSQHGGGPDSCLTIPSFAPQADLPMIMQYFEFITRSDNGNKILQPASPLLPVLKSVTPLNDPLASQLNKQFIPHTILFLDWVWPAEVNDAVMAAIPAVMTGAMTPDQATASVQKAYDTLVTEKSYKFDWWTTWTQDDWNKVTPKAIPTIEVKQ